MKRLEKQKRDRKMRIIPIENRLYLVDTINNKTWDDVIEVHLKEKVLSKSSKHFDITKSKKLWDRPSNQLHLENNSKRKETNMRN